VDDVPGSIHPLMTVTAISVTIASLAGIAIMVGVLPDPLGHELRPSGALATSAAVATFTTVPQSSAPAPCRECGTVESVRAVASVRGGVGLAPAGEMTAKNAARPFRHEIVVRLDDGALEVVTADSRTEWRGGERVRLVHGAAVPM
jgi:hypothetical protein